jgi:hypothetical protein
VNFRIPLAVSLPRTDMTYLGTAAGPTSHCPGPGKAGTGQLCVYAEGNHSEDFLVVYNPAYPEAANISASGFGLLFNVTDSSYGYSEGSRTVTAP